MRIFLSHAAVDRPIAEYVRAELIARRSEPTDVFLASRPGHILSGAEWWNTIRGELKVADAFLVLLTARSIQKPWIPFEFGAAWMTDRLLVVVSAGALPSADVPMPMSAFQISSLQDTEEAVAALRRLEASSTSMSDFCERVRQLSDQAEEAGMKAEGWQGVELKGRYFAWEGPRLHGLEPWPATPTPPGLEAALRDVKMSPRYGVKDRLTRHLAEGLVQVFETDKKTWRKEVLGGGDAQLLLAKPGSTE